jgi:superfamily II DNA or RNA helicase
MFYLYIIANVVYLLEKTIKIGSTSNPHNRLCNYHTSYPPNFEDFAPQYYRIYETNASNRDELYDFEEYVHDYFLKYRTHRSGHSFDSSEWFNFNDVEDPLKLIDDFVTSQTWYSKTVKLDDIVRPKTITSNYGKNMKFIKNNEVRLELLETIQVPVITKICDFINDKGQLAGFVIAPCGSGKTMMTTKAILNTKLCRVIICCPSNQIQEQWRNTLVGIGAFSNTDIVLIGNSGTTQTCEINKYMKLAKFCIITTNMSSNLLTDTITAHVQLIVLDEVHHMSGTVAKGDDGEGVTRKLLLRCYELGIKRLGLTYTPKVLTKACIDNSSISMDDEHIFGRQLASLNLRNLINLGILPDYRIWSLTDSSNKGSGILAKAKYLLDSWNKKEYYRGNERYIINHLIIFTASLEESRVLEEYFKTHTIDTEVLNVRGGDNTIGAIQQFSSAKRAICINCKVFNEGVDIPIADSVAITYPKQSIIEIIQMLLRAGRWYPDKPIFHILMPIIDSEDLTGFHEVLLSLASTDDVLMTELIANVYKGSSSPDSHSPLQILNCLPESVDITLYEGSKLEDINRLFKKSFIGTLEHKQIQKICMEKSIRTSVEYRNLRDTLVDLVEDPRNRGESWYSFLNPDAVERITPKEFVAVLDSASIKSAIVYDNWLTKNIKEDLPTIQNILDGYFRDETNFSIILEKNTIVKKSNSRR